MSSIRSLLFLPGEDYQYMTHKLVIIIQKAFKLCCIYAIGRFNEGSKLLFYTNDFNLFGEGIQTITKKMEVLLVTVRRLVQR